MTRRLTGNVSKYFAERTLPAQSATTGLLAGKPVVANGSIAKCHLFSQATNKHFYLHIYNFTAA